MLSIFGKVGPNRVGGDGATAYSGRLGWDGELITKELGGKFFEYLQRGQMFTYSTAAAGVVGAVAGTGTAPAIINPPGSNKLFVPLRIYYGAVAGAAVILSHVGWGYHRASTIVGTGADVVSLTEVAAIPALVGGSSVSQMRFAPATITFTGAVTYGGNLGISAPGALAAGPLFNMVADLSEGYLAFAPGQAFCPFISNAAIALTAAVAVVGLEIPYQG